MSKVLYLNTETYYMNPPFTRSCVIDSYTRGSMILGHVCSLLMTFYLSSYFSAMSSYLFIVKDELPEILKTLLVGKSGAPDPQ